MNLYEKNENRINIYSFEPIRSDMARYKEKVLKETDNNNLFYRFETTSETIQKRFLNGYEIDINTIQKDDNSKDFSDWWAQLGNDTYRDIDPFKTKKIEQQEIIKKYINGEYSDVTPTRILNYLKYSTTYYQNVFLVTAQPSSIYSSIEKRTYYKLENIINLPVELAILQLLEKGMFSQVLGSYLNIKDQLKLFKIELLDSVSIKEMNKMFDYGILTDAYSEAMQNVSNTQKILEKLK